MNRNQKGQFIKGGRSNRWNGGITYDSHGYRKIFKPGHQLSDSKGYVAEHRYVMCEFLGRILTKDEVVHHIDGNKINNSLSNLMVLSHTEHKRLHSIGVKRHRKLRARICNTCEKEFLTKGTYAKYCPKCKIKACKQCGNEYSSGNKFFCSVICKNLWKVGKQPSNTSGLALGRGWWRGKTHNHSPGGEKHWNYKERIVKICEWCQVPYKITPKSQKKKRFCSSSCRYAWCSHRMSSSNPSRSLQS